MTPVINPALAYWVHVISAFESLLSLAGFFLLAGSFLHYLTTFDHNPKFRNRKTTITCAVLGVVFLLTALFIPNEETLAYMIGLNYVTADNINNAAQIIKEIFIDITASN